MKETEITFEELLDPTDSHPYWKARDAEGRYVACILKAREPDLIFPDRPYAIWAPDTSLELGEFNTKDAAFAFVRNNTAEGKCVPDKKFRESEKLRYVIRTAFDGIRGVHAVAVANRWPGLEAKLRDAFAELEEIRDRELGD